MYWLICQYNNKKLKSYVEAKSSTNDNPKLKSYARAGLPTNERLSRPAGHRSHGPDRSPFDSSRRASWEKPRE
jgi:hypothetical protein